MSYLYSIHSPSKNKIYVGVTTHLQERLKKHNDHAYAGAFSKIATDWELIFQKANNTTYLLLDTLIGLNMMETTSL
ncbi:GIY-YIG nuclease family protein [Ascidiimonas sp. W6]|uniref:GIY-YIG nuclease family protein n=1 Tax=Ascidiimonas meishanensis TaxID=3128903 RepID=UPI0030EB2AB5